MKTCKRCEELKSEEDFYGADSSCKECRKALVRANRKRNEAHYKAYDAKRYAEQPKRKKHAAECSRRARNDGRHTEYTREWRERNPEKYKAHMALNNALARGKLSRGTECDTCGDPGKLHAHHHDYSKPLKVVWLCPKCHKAEHADFVA